MQKMYANQFQKTTTTIRSNQIRAKEVVKNNNQIKTKDIVIQKTSIDSYLCKVPLLFERCIRLLKRATMHTSINLTRDNARLNYLEIYLFI